MYYDVLTLSTSFPSLGNTENTERVRIISPIATPQTVPCFNSDWAQINIPWEKE